MSVWLKTAGVGGSLLALLALIITFFKQIIALITQLLALISFFMFAIKIAIVLIFVALIVGVGFMVFRSWNANRQPKN